MALSSDVMARLTFNQLEPSRLKYSLSEVGYLDGVFGQAPLEPTNHGRSRVRRMGYTVVCLELSFHLYDARYTESSRRTLDVLQ